MDDLQMQRAAEPGAFKARCETRAAWPGAGCGLTAELSDSRPAVVTSVTLDHQSASPKPAALALRSGAAVRSSDLVRPSGHSVINFSEQ
jgi:hypothetical protein